MISKKVFVTVGTTKFPKLINTISSEPVIETLIQLGYNSVQVQTGKQSGSFKIDSDFNTNRTIHTEGSSTVLDIDNRLKIKYDPYFTNFEAEINSADLVISHAGAGTSLEVLHKGKPLIVVINEDLMDNHQIELAEELDRCGYLYHCNCDNLAKTLKKDFHKLIKYPKPNETSFSNYLDKCVGFV